MLAQVLVRRGMGEPAAARAFLAAADEHPLDAFGGLREAAERILSHVRRGSRITVHGDYDVDGVSASAVLIRALRTSAPTSTGTCPTAPPTATGSPPRPSTGSRSAAPTCS